jgi:hypothetical protein
LALREQITDGRVRFVLTLALPSTPAGPPAGQAVVEARPTTRFVMQSEAATYAKKTDRITVRHPDGQVVAVIEVISPGNKDSRHAVQAFARKAVAFLHAGIHLLIIDLFPPSKRDPQGIHKTIWDRIKDEPFELPQEKPLTLAAYSAGGTITAYVEPVAVGDLLPNMPVFLTAVRHVLCPLEATYQASWAEFPEPLRGPLLERPA